MSNQNLTILSVDTPQANASIPFINGIASGSADGQINQGLEQSLVRASTPDDFTSFFSTVYDQTSVAAAIGALNVTPVLNATQRIENQVARVAIAPLACLLLLNLLYSALGILLTITALVAVLPLRISRARGIKARGVTAIRDAQARLSVAAIVAESFEAPNFGDDAQSLDDLFAERRGRVPRRVALVRGPQGGRRFKQIVNPEKEISNAREDVELVSGRDLKR